MLLTVLLLGLAGGPAEVVGQALRTPELSVQYRRAEAAWRSGASVLEAKARVDRVLAALPDDVAARKLRAQVLIALNRPAEALADARHAVALAPEDGEAHLILCEAARLDGDRTLAAQALDEAASLVLEDAHFQLRLSWNAALLGHLDRAEAYARTALAQDDTEAAAYYQLARVFLQRRQRDAAAAVLVQGFRHNALDPQAIRRDTLLGRIADHPDLSGWVR